MAGPAPALVGPAVSPSIISALNQITSQTSVEHKNVTPEKNQKGSVNCGGGGGGAGSGCGKPAACGGCSKKTKSCGGGGGGCGGSKKENPEKQGFKVTFKDLDGKVISKDFQGNDIGSVQQIEKDSSAAKPWSSDTEADQHPQGKRPGYRFKEWSASDTDLSTVTKNIDAKAIYEKDDRDFMTDSSWEDDMNSISEFESNCTEQYNNCIDGCVDTLDQTSVYINGEHINARAARSINMNAVMKVLEEHKTEVLEDKREVFEDIKKCIMNIQSTYVFQTRMLFNHECEQCRKGIHDNVDELLDTMVQDEPIQEKLSEMKEQFETQIYDITEDNIEAFTQFKTDLNKYIKELNTCFPSPILQQI